MHENILLIKFSTRRVFKVMFYMKYECIKTIYDHNGIGMDEVKMVTMAIQAICVINK